MCEFDTSGPNYATSVKSEMDVDVYYVDATTLDFLHPFFAFGRPDVQVFVLHSNSGFEHVVYIVVPYDFRMKRLDNLK